VIVFSETSGIQFGLHLNILFTVYWSKVWMCYSEYDL